MPYALFRAFREVGSTRLGTVASSLETEHSQPIHLQVAHQPSPARGKEMQLGQSSLKCGQHQRTSDFCHYVAMNFTSGQFV
jgi:hypothetical protein